MADAAIQKPSEQLVSVQIQALYHGDQVVQFSNLYSVPLAEAESERAWFRRAHPEATISVIPLGPTDDD